MTETTQPDPQVVACPRCMAPPGAACRTSGVGLARRPHESREVAVRRAARMPLTVADIPAGQGPASLYLVRDERGFPAVFYRDENGHPRPLRVEPAYYPPGVEALWEHLAATLPHVTTEETP